MSIDRILSQLLGSGAASGFAGGLAGGLASGLLTSKGGRKVGKKALKAEGTLDGAERYAIYEHVSSLHLSEVEKSTLLGQLARPIDMNRLVAAAETPEIAAEIYTASVLAINVDSPAERAYLAMLAARLELPDEFVTSVHAELSEAGYAPAAPVAPMALRAAS